MQLPTHFIAGALIDEALARVHLPGWARILTTGGLAYLSHGVLDKLAKATYHPPEPLDDAFWKGYHQRVLPVFTWATVLALAPRHAFAMLCAALPDLDWVVRGISRRTGRAIPGWEKPVLNEGLHDLLNRVPVVKELNRLPDWRTERKGVLVEAGLVAVMLAALFWFMRRKDSVR